MWDFGDDTTIINNNSTLFHEYDYNGTYNVKLHAEHKETGCFDSILMEEFINCTGGNDPPTGIINMDLNSEILISPNPFNTTTVIQFQNPSNDEFQLIVLDLSGKVYKIVDDITTSEYVLEKGILETGLYFIELRGPKTFRGKIIIE